MLSTTYSKTDQLNGRKKKKKKVVQSLNGETFRIFAFNGVQNQLWPYTDYGAMTYLHMSFSGKYIEFVPDSTQNIRINYIYELGDTQKIKLKFKYGTRLTIYAPSNVKDVTIVKPLNGVYGGFYFPSSIIAGDYDVKKGYITSGEMGYTLTSVAKSPYGGSRLVIELAIIEEF